MDDLLKALGEFLIEALGHALVGAFEHAVNHSPPRQALGILLGGASLIGASLTAFVIRCNGLSLWPALISFTLVGLFAIMSAYCSLTVRR